MRFGKDETKGKFFTKLSDNGVLKAFLSQSLSDTCSAMNLKGHEMLFQLLEHQKLLS